MVDVSPRPDGAVFYPIPELRLQANDVLTLILIKNTFVTYPNKMDGAVFRADCYEAPAWINSNYTGGIFACIDKAIICKPQGGICSDLWAPDPGYGDTIFAPEIGLLSTSLASLATKKVLPYRRASALDAQSRMFSVHSLPLAREQWKVEAEQIFQTSLARIQMTARKIARGTETANLSGPDLMDEYPRYRAMCQVFKFRTVGWKNISVAGVSFCVVGGLLIMICSIKSEEKLLVEGLPSLIYAFGSGFFSAMRRLYRRMRTWHAMACRQIRTLWADRHREDGAAGVVTMPVDLPPVRVARRAGYGRT
jgi:hypothetical protein